MNNTRLSVAKHEGKVRLHIEWPVEGDPELMRQKDHDIPVVHALAVAAAIVSEAAGILRFPAKRERPTPAEKTEEASPRPSAAPTSGDQSNHPDSVAPSTAAESVP